MGWERTILVQQAYISPILGFTQVLRGARFGAGGTRQERAMELSGDIGELG